MRRRTACIALAAFTALLLAGCSSPSTARVSSTALTTTSTPISTVQSIPTGTPTLEPTPLGIQWIPLASQSPSDVIAAAEQSDLFQLTGGDSLDLSHLGTPTLVVGISASNGAHLPDYYDIPVLDASGVLIGVVMCKLNANHTAINPVETAEYGQPHTNGSLAGITSQQALAEVSAQHHVSPKAGTQPQLIYFPFNQNAEDTGQINWKGGGNSPDDPMWEFVGTDGNQHFAGDDGHAYYWNQLPLAPSIG